MKVWVHLLILRTETDQSASENLHSERIGRMFSLVKIYNKIG